MIHFGPMAHFATLRVTAASAPPHRITFSRPFAPSEGHVAAPEKPYRAELCLNGSWRFQPVAVPPSFKPNAGDPPDLPPPTVKGWEATPIKIPSPWNVNAFNQGGGGDFRCYPSYPQAWNDVQMGWLKRTVAVPAAWKGRRLLLRFDAIAGDAQIYVNGHQVGENFDLFLPSQYDVTDFLLPGKTNEIRVGVRKASLFDNKGVSGPRPYPGGSMWGQAIAGIWQNVFLDAVPGVHVEDDQILPRVSKAILEDRVTVRNDGPTAQTVHVSSQVSPWVNLAGRSVLDAPVPKWRLGTPVLNLAAQTVTVPAGRAVTVTLQQRVGHALHFWSPDTPNLYGLVVSVSRDKQILDHKYTRFGWREFTFQGNHQLLNGKPLELHGDSWHFLGIPQMTRRYAWAWFKALKDAHGNAVRLHAQPYPSFYLDMADEMGICVLDETALWGSDAASAYDAPVFWTRADDHVRRLILRDRNHASVFGWSVTNEVNWFIGPNHPELTARLKQGWQTWLATARTLDPTRPWVSTDGDNDAAGVMPTSVSHYTPPPAIVHTDKPFGEGETGGAYYGTPPYAAKFAGPRAYESQQGRMEGIAREAYDLIKGERAVGASYVSVFNLVWYGLQPLEIGLTDTTRPATLQDGIFFPKFQEGVPGVQPERLGPYSTTLNPGYDPRLPLYRPWPLAEAIKAAYAPGKPAPSPWNHMVAGNPPASAIKPSLENVVVLGGEGSLLPDVLHAFGATTVNADGLGMGNFIIVDGAAPPTQGVADLKQRIADRVQQGATCLVLGASPATLEAVNALLPQPIALTDRSATSLLITSPDVLVNGMNQSDFYFTEAGIGPVIGHGLAGPVVKTGRVILTACPTDWSRWNNNPEPIKTAAVLRSEREAKPAGAALVESKSGRGRYLFATFDMTAPSIEILQTLTRMMANAGVQFGERRVAGDAATDILGHLSQVLACGSFGAASVDTLYETDQIGISDALKPVVGSKSAGLEWKALKAGAGGIFNFHTAGLPGPADNAAVYLSFWLWSPTALDHPAMGQPSPKLDLLMGSDDGCQVWLNTHLLKEDRGTHPLVPDSIAAESLPLQQGWNHFIVKVVQGSGEWSYAARFRCSDTKFLFGLRSSVTPPTGQEATK